MNLNTNLSDKIQYSQRFTTGIRIMKAFLATCAISRIGNLHSMNIFSVFLFLIIYIFFSVSEKEFGIRNDLFSKKQKLISSFLSFLFTAFYLSDTSKDLMQDFNNPLFKFIILSITAFGFYFLLKQSIYYLMCKLTNFSLSSSPITEKLAPYLPLICFMTCVLCRIPWFLYSYPGILTPDSINQFEQVLGMVPYSNHHPWLHTMTISLFYHIGTLFTTNTNLAFAFYTIFQICFMAFAASYLVWILSKYVKSVPIWLGIIAFYALLPYHNVMALCIWKDVLFSGTVLLFCTSLFHLMKEGCSRKTLFSTTIYVISGFLMCLYRSNGWYAFLLTVPFLFFAFRKQWKVMYPLHIFLFCLVLMVKGPVMNHYEVEQPDFIESLSIPLQQIGRTIATVQELTPEENQLLDQIVDQSHIPELYTEYISDNMKELVRAKNPAYLSEHKLDYFKLWLKLGLKYPGIYWDAYVAQTHGFYSPSLSYSIADVDGIIDNDTGLYREYLISGKVVVKLREILLKLQDIIPLYGSLWSMGSLFWSTLLFLGLTLSQCPMMTSNKKINYWDIFTIWLPNIAIIFTLLIATPVATEFRYAYNLAYCLPLYFTLMFINKN